MIKSKAYRLDKPVVVTGIGQLECVVLCDQCAVRQSGQSVGMPDGSGCATCKTLRWDALVYSAGLVWEDVTQPVTPDEPVDALAYAPPLFDDLDEIRLMLSKSKKTKVTLVRWAR